MSPSLWLTVAIFFSVFGTLSYVMETLRGHARPNRLSWFLWALPPLLAAAAQWSNGVGWPTLIVFISGFGPLLIFLVSFISPAPAWRIAWSDYACGLFSLLGMALWLATSNPFHAIAFGIVSDALAGIPTAIKSYTNPESEDGKAFVLTGLGCLISVLAMPQHTFIASAFTAYLLAMNILFCLLIYRPHLKKLFS